MGKRSELLESYEKEESGPGGGSGSGSDSSGWISRYLRLLR